MDEQLTKNDSLSEDQLFVQALASPDTPESEQAIDALRESGTRSAAERAMGLVQSADRNERLTGIDVMNDFGAKQNFQFQSEFAPLLVRTLETDDELQLLKAINCVAKTGTPAALGPLLRLASHRSKEVRLRVAQGLPSLTRGERLSEDHPLVCELLNMMTDDDTDVRDWATFGIGSQVSVDGKLIRSALQVALNDPDEDVRAEALSGLVQRRDQCAYQELVRSLTNESVGRLAVKAAAVLGDERLTDILQELTDWWDVDIESLEWALYRCSVGRTRREAEQMIELDRRVSGLNPGVSLAFSSTLGDGEITFDALSPEGAVTWWPFHNLLRACDGDLSEAAKRISASFSSG